MVRLEQSVEIDAPIQECFRYWTYFENYPQFLPHIKNVRHTINANHWHWEFADDEGHTLSWEGVIKIMEPNRLISFHSEDGSEMQAEGMVRFDEVHYGRTRITVAVNLSEPQSRKGEFAETAFKNPDQLLSDALECFSRFIMKQPAAIKSQSGLSASGSLQGKPDPVHQAESGATQESTGAQSHQPTAQEPGMPQPTDQPGDVPDIGNEYTTFGVSKPTLEEERKSHED